MDRYCAVACQAVAPGARRLALGTPAHTEHRMIYRLKFKVSREILRDESAADCSSMQQPSTTDIPIDVSDWLNKNRTLVFRNVRMLKKRTFNTNILATRPRARSKKINHHFSLKSLEPGKRWKLLNIITTICQWTVTLPLVAPAIITSRLSSMYL